MVKVTDIENNFAKFWLKFLEVKCNLASYAVLQQLLWYVSVNMSSLY